VTHQTVQSFLLRPAGLPAQSPRRPFFSRSDRARPRIFSPSLRPTAPLRLLGKKCGCKRPLTPRFFVSHFSLSSRHFSLPSQVSLDYAPHFCRCRIIFSCLDLSTWRVPSFPLCGLALNAYPATSRVAGLEHPMLESIQLKVFFEIIIFDFFPPQCSSDRRFPTLSRASAAEDYLPSIFALLSS